LQVLLRWRSQRGAHLEQLIAECPEHSGRHGFVQNVCYGVARNLRLLDFWIDHLSEGGNRRPDHRTRTTLRMGLYELMHMETAAHAAVHEAVTLAGKAGAYVNAILRRALRERSSLEEMASGASLAVRCSHPDFLVDRWVEHFGFAQTEALCAWDQQPAPVYVRENDLRVASGSMSSIAGTRVEWNLIGGEATDFRKVEQLPLRELEAGRVYAQDPSTALACCLLAPQAGQRVLDACASPGGKTALLAGMMGNRGQILATDARTSRLGRLRENLDRLGVRIAGVQCVDWGREHGAALDEFGGAFDRILVDVPCSNSGVLRRRVDARWRINRADFARLGGEQLAILADAARFLAPGGRLVYSTCSVDPEENRGVVDAFLTSSAGWLLEGEKISFPPDSGYDGSYAAALVRNEGVGSSMSGSCRQ
jgi:16S rRNA (cytosine967-C5)-methyltransferase